MPEPRLVTSGHSSLLTYEPYYGLREKPFSLSADPRFFYKTGSHAPAFEDLLAGIRRREGLVVLTGDIGTGKTTLCRAVLDRLDRKTFSAFIPDPFVSREDLLKMLLIDFGVMSVDDLRSGRLNGATRPDLSYPLYEFLNSLVPLQAFAVVILDEAQNLSLPLLEEIRILSDLEDREKLLQVVLVGQLEFLEKLRLPQMRQVEQRVSVRCTLEPLSREGVQGYISHRIEVAGGGPDRVGFSAGALDVVTDASGGVPRLINRICDRALHRGYLNRITEIDAATVWAAVGDLGLRAGRGPTAPARPVEPAPADPVADQVAAARRVLSSLDLKDFVEPPAAASHPAVDATPCEAPPAEPADDLQLMRQAMDLTGVMEQTAIVPEEPAGPEGPAGSRSGSTLFGAGAPEPAAESWAGNQDRTPELRVSQPFEPVLAPTLGMLRLRETSHSSREPGISKRRAGIKLGVFALALAAVAGLGLAVLYVGPQAGGGDQSTLVYLPGPPPAVRPSLPVFGARWVLDESAAVPLRPDAQPPAQGEKAVAAQRPAGSYVVQVALFAGEQRATRLIETLTQAGFRAYRGELVIGSATLHQVLVGPYASQADAEADRDRVRQLPDHADARVAAAPAPAASR